jgi:hypothetical protein
MPQRRSRLLALPVLLAYTLSAAGCYSWHPTTLAPPPSASELPNRLRVTLPDGQRVRLDNPRIERESLRSDNFRTVAVADLQSVESRSLQKGRTIVLVTVVGTVLAGIVAAMTVDMGGGFLAPGNGWGGGPS